MSQQPDHVKQAILFARALLASYEQATPGDERAAEDGWELAREALSALPPPLLVRAMTSYCYSFVAALAATTGQSEAAIIQRMALADEKTH